MGIALVIRPCVRFVVIAFLHHHFLGQNVLLFKKGLERTLYLIHRPRPFVESGKHGNQHIGIMLDLVEVKVVFVIAVGSFVAGKILPQLVLQGTVLRFLERRKT